MNKCFVNKMPKSKCFFGKVTVLKKARGEE